MFKEFRKISHYIPILTGGNEQGDDPADPEEEEEGEEGVGGG